MAHIVDRGKDRPARWQVRYRIDDRGGAQRARAFRTLDEAKAFMSRVDVDMRDGAYVDPQSGSAKFGPWAEQVVASWHDLRPTSLARARSALDAQILPHWENVAVGRIHPLSVQAWVDDMQVRGLAPSTIHKTVQIMSKIMAAAERARPRMIQSNPCVDLTLPTIERHEARFLEPDEVMRLADAMPIEYRALVYVGAVCGLRAGELFGLRWRSVSMLGRWLEVAEIVTEANGVQHVGEPKTKASRRRVPMPEIVRDELAAHAARQGRPEPADLVFPAPAGGHVRGSGFRSRVWKPACIAAGLGTITRGDDKRDHYDGLVLHELRHSAVAGWIEAGATPVEIAARAGHRSVVTIQDVYGHRFPAQAERVNDAIDDLYRRARGDG